MEQSDNGKWTELQIRLRAINTLIREAREFAHAEKLMIGTYKPDAKYGLWLTAYGVGMTYNDQLGWIDSAYCSESYFGGVTLADIEDNQDVIFITEEPK